VNVEDRPREALCIDGNVRWYVTVSAQLLRESPDGTATQEVRIRHPANLLTNDDDIDAQIESASATLDSRMEAFTEVEGSGWTVGEFYNLEINIAAYNAILDGDLVCYVRRWALQPSNVRPD